MSEISERRLATNTNPQFRRRQPRNYRAPSFWREYVVQSPTALLIALAGGFVHVVAWCRVLDRGKVVIVGFTALGIVVKLSLQEAARHYILTKRIRSIRTMCILVGVPTVLIDTQSRIVLLGTQTNTFLVSGTFAMAVAEMGLRVGKAAYVAWQIRRRAAALAIKLSTQSANSGDGEPSPLSVQMEFELWRRQVLSYHTAELEAGSGLSEIGIARWRFNQVVMLGFQFVVEIFVDYVCVVMEMAAGIDFDRIESLSTFLGMLFMTMAAVNINISSAVYLS
ncbi:hypothetical protein PF002_g13328 [Phytophthora fragariae]|uniref:Uncharacterized protein n=2 Tax=Phytophthora fragariae TaxID=53985 RepID=A0A6A3FAF4_9STRA|nr:hypothetical protein PF003_g36198 [Phytophthora fragariae]KAE8942242.1 hypothetical protein PF009_g7991 [Phytophthora fragariae]KAE9008482.1 hypothetical protein PF011_g10690 [Phytophthora fragariae]KAE9229322.1 hypothetical protein PF002_g13328 [Phytophthora fragariae]KAE9340462.1 hypothetical protein PF008_g11100 [Phytophthora fragariae]